MIPTGLKERIVTELADDLDEERVRRLRDLTHHLKALNLAPAEALDVLRRYIGDQITDPRSDHTPARKFN
jgi:hypothetical protein